MSAMDHRKRDEMALDEKFVEHEQGSTVVSVPDAAMTRRILLKLDFRYGWMLLLQMSE